MKISKLGKDKYKWLKNSEFYFQIDLEDTKIDVPYCSINETDVELLLKVINFWGVKKFLPQFLDLIFDTDNIHIIEYYHEVTKSKFYGTIHKIICLLLVSKDLFHKKALEISVENNEIDLVEYFLLEKDSFSKFCDKNETLLWSIKNKNLEIFKLLHLNDFSFFPEMTKSICTREKWDILKYACENGFQITDQDFLDFIVQGNVDCVEYLFIMGFYCKYNAITTSCGCDQLNILKIFHEGRMVRQYKNIFLKIKKSIEYLTKIVNGKKYSNQQDFKKELHLIQKNYFKNLLEDAKARIISKKNGKLLKEKRKIEHPFSMMSDEPFNLNYDAKIKENGEKYPETDLETIRILNGYIEYFEKDYIYVFKKYDIDIRSLIVSFKKSIDCFKYHIQNGVKIPPKMREMILKGKKNEIQEYVRENP